MGHILFGAPDLADYHLHDHLALALMARGHRACFLATDPAELDFYSMQGKTAVNLGAGQMDSDHVPVGDFALLDCALAGEPAPGRWRREAATRALTRRVTPLRRLLERDPPDLVLLHQGRSGLHRLIHYLAREAGCQILHTGAGMLPQTMQRDSEGIDGDASSCRRRAVDYRRSKSNPTLLSRALSGWLADAHAPPLIRTRPCAPRASVRLTATAGALLQGRWSAAWHALRGWRKARSTPAPMPGHLAPPPPPPFLAVLLQADDCPRIRLDAPPGTRSVDLALATVDAASTLDRGITVVAVLPPGGLPAADQARLARAGVVVLATGAAPQTIATAVAVVTVNHPLGVGALLANTPLLHTARTPYGIPGVCTQTSAAQLENDLPRALALQTDALRERFLTRHLGSDHVWCSPATPDLNGLTGLVADIEQRMRTPAGTARATTYRAGPVWPLERLK